MVIPIILLGEARDRHLLDALRSLLGERCARQTREGIFWKEGAAVMLLDLPASSWVDAGGGLVVLKESFCCNICQSICCTQGASCPIRAEKHCCDADCPASAAETQGNCGCPARRRMRSFVYKPRWLDWTAAALHRGEHLFSLPSNLSAYEMLCCAAVLLLLGMEK